MVAKNSMGLEPQGVLPYRERRRKITMRRVQLKGGLGALRVSPL
jgi:hypothetical protein